MSGIQRIVSELKSQYENVRREFKTILRSSYDFMSKFLSVSKNEDFVSSVNRFTETRIISSKISTVLTSLMLEYTNILIHHLLKAGSRVGSIRGGLYTR